MPPENSGHIPQKPLLHQQGPPTSLTSSLPPSYGPPIASSQFPGQQQYSGQTITSHQGPNIPRSTPQPTPPTSTHHQSQMPSQNRYGPSMINEADLAGPPLPGKLPPVPINSQQSFRGSPMPGQPQQSMPGPPPSGSYISNTANANRQNLPGPPMPGSNFQGPPPINQQHISKPPLPGQISGLSGPPLPGQANLPGAYGQTSATGPPPLPGQQNLHSQYSYGNQIPDQRRYSSSPSMPGQPNSATPYSHINHQHSDTGYQGYQQQQNYNQTGQSVSI